ncbi:hypothetical protein IBA8401_26060 [Pseudomonas syringae]
MLQKYIEHRGHKVQQGDARVTHDLCQIVRVLMATGTRHDQFGTGQQRQEKFPDRHVEAERGLLQHAIIAVHLIGVTCPEQAVNDSKVLVHHAFGRAGGTGGVQHVGQVVWLQTQGLGIRINARLLSHLREVIAVIEHQHRKVQGRQVVVQILSGQHRPWRAVFEHIGLASAGQVRIDRHVGATGLENTQQRHDHFRSATQADRNSRIRLHAQFDQAMGELVGLLVEFGVGEQRSAVAAYGAGIRTLVDLVFDQLVNQHIAWIRVSGIIEARQQQLALVIRQYRQAVQRGMRGVFQRFHQAVQCNLHVLADALGIDLLDGLNSERESIAQVIDVQGQRVVGIVFGAERLDPFPGGGSLCRNIAHDTVPVVEQCTE